MRWPRVPSPEEAAPAGPAVPSGVDHVAWAVRDLGRAAGFFLALDGRVVAGGDESGLNVRSLHITFPGPGKVELLSPLGPGPIADFVERYGERVHHVTFSNDRADGLAAVADDLTRAGHRAVDLDTTGKAWQEFFVGPRAAFGCIVQVVDRMDQYGPAVAGLDLESVLAGEWRWERGVPVRSGPGPQRGG
jgi:methylmalonyl-CoA/ethylmalonyl-CoA epimerase